MPIVQSLVQTPYKPIVHKIVTQNKDSSVIELITQNMSGGIDWTNQTTASTDLSYAEQITTRVQVTINDFVNASGVIWEAGGSSIGAALYVHNSVLYLGGSDGNGGNNSPAALNMSYTLTKNGTFIIETILDRTNGALYIDGILVDTDTSNGSETITGSDTGGIGKTYSSIRENEAGYEGDGVGIFSETIDSCIVWKNQVP